MTKPSVNVIFVTNSGLVMNFTLSFTCISSNAWEGVKMNVVQNVSTGGIKVKKKGHPVGRLGAHIKHGVGASFEAYLREESRMAALAQGAGFSSQAIK